MKIINNKARFNYEVYEILEAGIVLTGAEAKAIRAKKVDFLGSYIKILSGEVFLINLHIGVDGIDDTRKTRKLLLNKKEIVGLGVKIKQQKLTLIPLSLYTAQSSRPDGRKGRLIKCEVGLVRGKREYDKRAQIKAQDIKRDIEREVGTY